MRPDGGLDPTTPDAALQHRIGRPCNAIVVIKLVLIKLTLFNRGGTLCIEGETIRSQAIGKQAHIGPRGSYFSTRQADATKTTGGRMKFVDALHISRVLAVGLLALPGTVLANADVENLTADPKNWAMQAGDMYNQRYS